jgi:dipeptidyl aminopeptidase/acylaminoacyl peptidase
VKGAIFYWSTTAKGIRRANIAASAPENYLTGLPSTVYPVDNKVKCVACHVVSRDGKYLLGAVDAEEAKGLWITEVTVDAPPDPLVTDIDGTKGHGFATISPDDARVIASWGDKTWLLDRATGAFQANVPTGGAATHPDWSPDNTQIVFARGKGDNPTGAALFTLPYLGGTSWGALSTLVPANGQSNLFPMFSADGKWVAYARGKGGSHGDKTLQLHIVSGAGGTPVELTAANRVVSNRMTDGQHQNSQPTWAPTGDFYWVAFNSHREYGVVRAAGTQQIWVAAVDPARLDAGGADPSYPAFRLQFQGLDEDNHRAFWTQDVRYPDPPPPPPPMDGGTCIPHLEPCDPAGATPCCDANDRCDTRNDGETYECRLPFLE